eukprot:5467845-Pyramimonas_sp.AAC.1
MARLPKRERGGPVRKAIKPQIAPTKHHVEMLNARVVCMRCGRRAAAKRMKRKLWESERRLP